MANREYRGTAWNACESHDEQSGAATHDDIQVGRAAMLEQELAAFQETNRQLGQAAANTNIHTDEATGLGQLPQSD